MNILSPSILSADFTRLGQQITAATQAGAQYIHIDVMDGVFVPSISYGMPVIKSIRSVTDCVFDVHLMITDPIRYIDEFAEVGADIITFHQEAASDPGAVIDAIHRNGRKAGMSVKPHTNIDAFAPFLDQLDLFLKLTAFDLVQLRCNNDRLVTVSKDPFIHNAVVVGRCMTDINQKKYCVQHF